MKKLPVGIQTFRDIINDDYLYVDKTKDIHRLLTSGSKYFFLARPRRFGKSLLISTLRELFSGKRELFEGLWIYDKIQWHEYPVIHLDFLGKKYGSEQELLETLEFMLSRNAERYGIQLKEKGYDKRFNELIRELAKIDRVVILVDEYDKPIINHIEQEDVAFGNRNILRIFYESIKEADEFLKFVMVTGVSKFSKVSIFSGLNNLDDITIDDRFITLLGYTHDEFLHYFSPWLQEMDVDLEDIKKWYNGYSWDGKNFLYNPLSVLQFFNKRKFGNYWFSTGTPTFLLKAIRNHNIDIKRMENYQTNKLVFDSFDIDRINVFAILLQTGYLTIKEAREISPTQVIYRLSYPNEEVKESFLFIMSEINNPKISELAN